jgi:hypothetical protein
MSGVGSIVDGLAVELDEVLDVGFRVAVCRFQARVQPRWEFVLRSSFGCRSFDVPPSLPLILGTPGSQ